MTVVTSALALWGWGLVGLSYLALALAVLQMGYLRQPRNAPQVSVFVALLLSAVWGGLVLAAGSVDAPSPWLSMLVRSVDHLRYGVWFVFLLTVIRPLRAEQAAGEPYRLAPIAAWLTAGALTADLIAALDVGWLGEPARLAYFMSTVLAVFALLLIEQVYRNLPQDLRWNAKPLCLGLGGAFLFDLYVFSQAALFGRPDGDALDARGFVYALITPLLLLTFSRRKSWISRLRLSQKAAFHSATLMLAGIYLLFISAVGYWVRFFGGEWGRVAQLALMFAALVGLVTIAVSGSMRAKLRVHLVKHFFSYRYDYREEWLKFTQTLSAKDLPEQMGLNVIRGLADMVESPAGALWMRNAERTAFGQVARWNMPQTTATEEAVSPLCRFLTDTGRVVDLPEWQAHPQRYADTSPPDWLHHTSQAWLLVPLLLGDDLIGFVVLANARTRIEMNWEIFDLLKTAGRQAASFLAQMQATEALLEARKFDAFNRMSAFVVHDLKNIVTQLSLMMKNAQRLRANPEFQEDMLMTVENSLERMRQLMLQLREGATPAGTSVGVDLSAVARRIADTARSHGSRLELEIIDAVATRGQQERLERILGHVVQNAFDATTTGGCVWLRLQRRSGQACVEVGDTGVGMSAEFLKERLFKPFQTTKKSGMGIGAYESFQYVRELGGEIAVVSEIGQGTRVTISLPLFELRTESDLHSLET